MRLQVLLTTFLLAASTTFAQESRKPNVIVILTDDMGYGELTSYGPGSGVPTPNIDRLANEGARFTRYYTPAPICSPSRAALMSGQFPGRHHLNSYLQTRSGNRIVEQNDFLDPKAATLPHTFKKAGYHTAHFGKWHMGGGRDVDNAPSINEYGFDEHASTWESPNPHPDLGVKFPPWNKETEPGQVKRHNRTAYMVDRTIGFLKQHKEEPCFINLWPDDTHTPFRPSPEMAAKYGASEDERKTPKKNYLAVLEEYDRQIGRLLDGIRDLGLEKDTIVIFTCDNGPEPHFEHTRTGGLRGMKLSLYEGGIRVPFLIRWPGKVSAGHVDSSTVLSGLDMTHTLCKLAGVELPQEKIAALDGQDMSAAILGKPITREKILFWEYGRKRNGYGYPHLPGDRSPNVAVQKDNWKLLINDNGTSTELYNLLEDPNETTNVADRFTSRTEDLSSQALAWRKTLPDREQPGEDGKLAKRPNVIVIVADDLGYADLSIQGNKAISTPNIDAIAHGGTRFTNAYVTCPVCGPTRAGLLTGRYQQRFGFEHNSGPEGKASPQFGLPSSEKILSEYLKDAGYTTGMVGKWHLGYKPELTPPQRGFDSFFGFLGGFHGYYADQAPPRAGPILRGDKPVEEKEYLTDAFAREAVAFIDENRKKQFFLYLPFNAVHTPLQVPKELEDQLSQIENPEERKIAAMTVSMDKAVGKVLQALRERHIEDNTMIFFLSDNGGTRSNGALRAKKGSVYEGGVRVPYLMQWRGQLPGGRVNHHVVSSLDIVPTILDAAGISLAGGKELDGKSLLPYLKDPVTTGPHEAVYWRYGDRKAVRRGDWKLVSKGDKWELYNLAQDVAESNDLAQTNPAVVEELTALWQTWSSQLQDPKWTSR